MNNCTVLQMRHTTNWIRIMPSSAVSTTKGLAIALEQRIDTIHSGRCLANGSELGIHEGACLAHGATQKQKKTLFVECLLKHSNPKQLTQPENGWMIPFLLHWITAPLESLRRHYRRHNVVAALDIPDSHQHHPILVRVCPRLSRQHFYKSMPKYALLAQATKSKVFNDMPARQARVSITWKR